MNNSKVRSKLDLDGERVWIRPEIAIEILSGIFSKLGCEDKHALQIAEHLTDSSLCGMESHGLMRTLQYAEQFQNGYMQATAAPGLTQSEQGGSLVDGNGGHGVPAMHLAIEESLRLAKEQGVSALGVVNVGHTGRLGAFADAAASQGFLNIIFGGGGRENWRQVAPYGGRQAMLPTNPYCIGIPGGERGPVVLDFATSKIAGGWIYAARSAGARLPDNVLMDTNGEISRDPEDYFKGGAILPAGGAKGYALAVVAELVAEAMLGPVSTEGSWLMLSVDTSRFRQPGKLQVVAEEILAELRGCPPAPGYNRVEVPGEREREYRQKSLETGIAVPEQTWNQIQELASKL
ncbi:MAG: LDH2 family malate/lactate/ureidoglycolate dehydrogenase [Parasphingorhabdus sp.]|jgi:LDH2 family malate/lactate/ureidoglycolate dehydrogenase